MTIIQSANLALRFLLELCALAALGYWGFQAGPNLPIKIALGVGAPLLAAIFWGAFVAPKAAVQVSEPLRAALGLLVFALAAAGLVAAGRLGLAWVFGAVALANAALMWLWRQ
jgi:hypothetical protein